MSNVPSQVQSRSEGLTPGAADLGCQANDLKGLLNAIVNQISEAERRQSDTLHQMQDRLAHLGNDAKSLRARVPDHFQAAFERIEAGMSELAARIAEAQGHAAPATFPAPYQQHGHADYPAPAQDAFGTPAPATPAHQDSPADEPPMVLRSAQSPAPSNGLRPKLTSAVDTFDIIESLPGDVGDPWDRESAAALASVYDAEPRGFTADPYAASPAAEAPRAFEPAMSLPDQGWFEKRLSEVSERIEASLAEIRPDQAFFALGQRLDQFERSFAQAFENVATRNDVESVRLIESHMVEIVEHLEQTHNQLTRIDSIESQLGAIAQRLDEVHALAGMPPQAGPAAEPAPAVDLDALARAAAHEAAMQAAQRFAATPQEPPVVEGLDDMRRLMEQSISSSRQSEENTTALLDTLQQAMIRLLDRIDAIELNQHQAAQQMAMSSAAASSAKRAMQPSIQDYESAPRYSEPSLPYPGREATEDELDDAVAAVASRSNAPRPAPAAAAPSPAQEASEASRRDSRAAGQAPQEPRSADKLRQDFIADARRAKMRLSGDDGDSIVLSAPTVREAPAAPAAKGAPAPGKGPRATARRQPLLRPRHKAVQARAQSRHVSLPCRSRWRWRARRTSCCLSAANPAPRHRWQDK